MVPRSIWKRRMFGLLWGIGGCTFLMVTVVRYISSVGSFMGAAPRPLSMPDTGSTTQWIPMMQVPEAKLARSYERDSGVAFPIELGGLLSALVVLAMVAQQGFFQGSSAIREAVNSVNADSTKSITWSLNNSAAQDAPRLHVPRHTFAETHVRQLAAPAQKIETEGFVDSDRPPQHDLAWTASMPNLHGLVLNPPAEQTDLHPRMRPSMLTRSASARHIAVTTPASHHGLQQWVNGAMGRRQWNSRSTSQRPSAEHSASLRINTPTRQSRSITPTRQSRSMVLGPLGFAEVASAEDFQFSEFKPLKEFQFRPQKVQQNERRAPVLSQWYANAMSRIGLPQPIPPPMSPGPITAAAKASTNAVSAPRTPRGLSASGRVPPEATIDSLERFFSPAGARGMQHQFESLANNSHHQVKTIIPVLGVTAAALSAAANRREYGVDSGGFLLPTLVAGPPRQQGNGSLKDLTIGGDYETTDDMGNWWQIKVIKLNGDGSYTAVVPDRPNLPFTPVWAENTRPFDGAAGDAAQEKKAPNKIVSTLPQEAKEVVRQSTVVSQSTSLALANDGKDVSKNADPSEYAKYLDQVPKEQYGGATWIVV